MGAHLSISLWHRRGLGGPGTHGGGPGASQRGPGLFVSVVFSLWFSSCVVFLRMCSTGTKHFTDPQVKVPTPPSPRAPLTLTFLLLSLRSTKRKVWSVGKEGGLFLSEQDVSLRGHQNFCEEKGVGLWEGRKVCSY